MSKNPYSATKRKKRKCISLDTKYEIIQKNLKGVKTSDQANGISELMTKSAKRNIKLR